MLIRDRWLLFSLTLGLALLDQASKWLAKLYLDPSQPLSIIPNVFQLSLAYNTGAAFSILRNQPLLLTGFTSVLFLVLLFYALSRPQYLKGELLGLALILGGALGNLLDRIFLGRVTDFFDLVVIRYPVFNVADSFIFCGVILLIIIHLKSPSTEEDATHPVCSHEPTRNS